MSIVLLTAPNPTSPGSISDYQYQNAYLTATLQAFTGRVLADGTTIRAGSVIKVADLLYKATTDTAITGAETPYIKITPAGASASASFVSSLTGVSWSHAHGQYLDVSGNAYFFDEGLALSGGVVSVARTEIGRAFYAPGPFRAYGPVTFDGAVTYGLSTTETLTSPNRGELTMEVSPMHPGETRAVTWNYDVQPGTFQFIKAGAGGMYLIIKESDGSGFCLRGGGVFDSVYGGGVVGISGANAYTVHRVL